MPINPQERPEPAATAVLPPPSEPPDAVAQTLALIRPWINYVPQRQRRIGLFIFLALLVHLSVFLFLRIDTTRSEIQHQTRTRVTVENPQLANPADAEADRFWDALNDPRLYLLPSSVPAAIAPTFDFAAINFRLSSAKLPPVAPGPAFTFLPDNVPPVEQRAAADLLPRRQPFHYEEPPPVIAAATTWSWDAALAQRQPLGAPALPSPVSDVELSPTQLRVAVGPTGAVEHVLLELSCGKLELDQQAILAARKARFAPRRDQPGPQWGLLTVHWHYTPTPREVVVPTPPSSL